MNAWVIFYKGTFLQFPYEHKIELIALWESTIVKGLRCGISIEQQKKDCKEDLDELEEWIVGMVGGKEKYDNDDIEKKIGKKDFKLLLNKWGLNVVCGLKLKVINNDNTNGHLFISEK